MDITTGITTSLLDAKYLIKIEMRGNTSQLDPVTGVLFDFYNVTKITDMLCYNTLNDVIDASPSAENISLFIYHKLHEMSKKELLFKVKVYENIVLKEAWAEVSDF